MSILYLTSQQMITTTQDQTVTLGRLAKAISFAEDIPELMNLIEKGYPGFIALCAIHDSTINLDEWVQ